MCNCWEAVTREQIICQRLHRLHRVAILRSKKLLLHPVILRNRWMICHSETTVNQLRYCSYEELTALNNQGSFFYELFLISVPYFIFIDTSSLFGVKSSSLMWLNSSFQP